MTRYQVRGACACAPLIDPGLEGITNTLITGQTQVIVAAKIQQVSAVDVQHASLRARDDTALPVKTTLP